MAPLSLSGGSINGLRDSRRVQPSGADPYAAGLGVFCPGHGGGCDDAQRMFPEGIGLRRILMLKKVYDVKVIGTGLAVLYAMSLFIFMRFAGVVDLPFRTYFYILLFAILFVSAVAVISLQEWGRKLIVALNGVMFLCLFARYIPQIDMVPLAYIFMNIVVLLYFSQSSIRLYFHGKKFRKWYSILVVDDDEILLKTIRPLLISHGCSVLTAASGEEGLQIVKIQKPDMVILDVLLPKMKGREVCRVLKEDESTKNIPVVFLTAKDSSEDIEAEMAAGAAAHLTKPLNPRQLIATIRDILEPKHGQGKS